MMQTIMEYLISIIVLALIFGLILACAILIDLFGLANVIAVLLIGATVIFAIMLVHECIFNKS